MKATFENTVNILVKAYFNDTLQHCNCAACAVGNMIADAKGIELYKNNEGQVAWRAPLPIWIKAIGGGEIKSWVKNFGQAIQEAESTGYTTEQIVKIEYEFEYGVSYPDESGNDDVDGYFGLMRVLSVLAEIHNVSLEATQEARNLFVKA